jgi:polyisoprenoid-binding protein YceI
MGISVWRGKFDRTQGSVTLDRANHTGTFQIEVDTASINFGLDVMDTRARSDDYLKTQMFPKATYVGKLIFTGDTPTAVEGTLTFMGVSRPLRLTLDWFKCITRMGHLACGSEAEGTLHWAEFGMAKFPDGTDELRWHIQVEATRT